MGLDLLDLEGSRHGTGETDRAVDSVEHSPRAFPWRTATLIASAVATLELLGLIVVGAFVLAHPFRHAAKHTTTTAAAATVVHHAAPVRHIVPVPAKDRFAPTPSHPLRARSLVRVLVLNANGVQGAAHAEAARLQALGYPDRRSGERAEPSLRAVDGDVRPGVRERSASTRARRRHQARRAGRRSDAVDAQCVAAGRPAGQLGGHTFNTLCRAWSSRPHGVPAGP